MCRVVNAIRRHRPATTIPDAQHHCLQPVLLYSLTTEAHMRAACPDQLDEGGMARSWLCARYPTITLSTLPHCMYVRSDGVYWRRQVVQTWK